MSELSNKGKVVGPLFNLRGSNSWKRLKVGNVSGSYFKRATKEPMKLRSELWLATEDKD